MFEIHFYLRDKRTKKAKEENRPLPFQIEMHINCGLPKSIVQYTGERILPGEWDKKKQKGKGKFHDTLNSRLSQQKRKAEDIFYDLKERGTLSVHNFKYALSGGKTDKGFFDYFEDFISASKSRVSKVSGAKLKNRTFQHYNTVRDGFKELAKKYPVTLQGMDMKFYDKARTYFINELELHPNTFGNYIKGLKTFLGWATLQGLPVNQQYKQFEKPANYEEAEPLTAEELISLWDLKLESEYQTRNLDVFLFLCSTGLRISDYNALTKANFKKEYIDMSQIKTSGQAIIPFFDDRYFRPKYIYDKYNGELPKISGQKLNDSLVKIAEKAKISRIKITSKTGRKTFATLKLMQGVSPYTVMKSTGHKDYKSFQAYVGISPDDVIRENKEKAALLKVS